MEQEQRARIKKVFQVLERENILFPDASYRWLGEYLNDEEILLLYSVYINLMKNVYSDTIINNKLKMFFESEEYFEKELLDIVKQEIKKTRLNYEQINRVERAFKSLQREYMFLIDISYRELSRFLSGKEILQVYLAYIASKNSHHVYIDTNNDFELDFKEVASPYTILGIEEDRKYSKEELLKAVKDKANSIKDCENKNEKIDEILDAYNEITKVYRKK